MSLSRSQSVSIPSPSHSVQAPRMWLKEKSDEYGLAGMQDAGCGMRDTGCGMQDAGCRMRDAGCGMRDAGCRMQDAGC
ncbi:MAG: hypothetical protein WCO02_16410, partial [Bacteroidota bacterium]